MRTNAVRISFYVGLVVIAILNAVAGQYLFGQAKVFVAMLCVVAAGFSLLYFGMKDQSVLLGSASIKRKKAMLRLLAVRERKRKEAAADELN
jgi:hypothetical protein